MTLHYFIFNLCMSLNLKVSHVSLDCVAFYNFFLLIEVFRLSLPFYYLFSKRLFMFLYSSIAAFVYVKYFPVYHFFPFLSLLLYF